MLNQEQDQEDTVKTRTIRRLEKDMGAELLAALFDPKTTDLMLNPDGTLWQKKLGTEMFKIGSMSPVKALAIINTIASFHRVVITSNDPSIEAEFPIDGSRFAGQIPPIVSNPTFAIRKKATHIFPIESYVENGIMSQQQADTIIDVVKSKGNILVVGGTGSGKTTLVNAILLEMVRAFPKRRPFIIEDTGELQCAADNFVQYHTSLDRTMAMLLKITLRMNPCSISVGEVRGEEALDLIDSWSTGHEGGAGTLHANSAMEGLSRLRSLITRNKFAPAEIEPLIGAAVQLVVFITETSKGRKVNELLRVNGYFNGQYSTTKL
jgi:type IV secretion system protein TrbB